MKRHPCLQPLSDDHHRALVLAHRLRRLSKKMDPADLEALSREIEQEFEAELEPHFRVEERRLLPALEAGGAGGLAEQTMDDHARLRDLVRGVWAKDTAAQLGELLEKHVRFEERVLFPKVEVLLPEVELAVLGPRWTPREAGSGPAYRSM